MTGSRSDRTTVTAVCLEVAGPDQMSGWLDQGWMPNLRAVRDAGAFLPLRSVANISSGAIWPSFTTGTMPERHGQFFTHMQLEPGTYRIGKHYADDVPFPPFWEALEPAGLTSALIDVPADPPEAWISRGACGWLGRRISGLAELVRSTRADGRDPPPLRLAPTSGRLARGRSADR